MEGHPPHCESGTWRVPDGSSSGSARSPPQRLPPFQEYILNLSEGEWMVFSSMLHTPMTRTQFAELCMAVLKVVSLSSIAIILPAYVGVAKDVEALTSSNERSQSSAPNRSSKTTSPESLKTDVELLDESESASSAEMPGGPANELMGRIKGVLASLCKTVAWSTPAEDTDTACTVSERSAHTETTRGDASHDLTCITTILEKLVSSGRVHQIAKKLVSQVQDFLKDSDPTSIPVAASKSLSESVLSIKVKTVPKRTLSATHLVNSYAEEAIKNLLQPYFLPLVAWSGSENITTSKMSSSSNTSSHPRRATTKGTSPSLLGLEKEECSCLMTRLMKRLPADISYQESMGSFRPSSATRRQVTTSFSQGFREVADLFARVMTFQVIDIVDSEFKRHAQATLQSPDKGETTTEGAMPLVADTVPGPYGGLFSGLIQRFLSEFRYTESVLPSDVTGTPSSPRSLSTSPDSISAPQKLKKVLGLFTRVMVNQVMDIIQMESAARLVSPMAEDQVQSYTSRPSSSLLSDEITILGSDVLTDGASTVDSDSSGNACLISVLMLRLLVKLRDQPTASSGTVVSSRELLEKILSEFSSATGGLNFHIYPNNVKIQAIYKAMDKFLMKEFGPETLLQKAVETQDDSFDAVLLSALRKELLSQCAQSASVLTTALTAPSTTPSAQSASHSLEPMQEAEDVTTARKKSKRRFKMKMPKLLCKKVAPTHFSESVETPAHHSPSVSISGQRACKRSSFIKMFTSCFQGSSES